MIGTVGHVNALVRIRWRNCRIVGVRAAVFWLTHHGIHLANLIDEGAARGYIGMKQFQINEAVEPVA